MSARINVFSHKFGPVERFVNLQEEGEDALLVLSAQQCRYLCIGVDRLS